MTFTKKTLEICKFKDNNCFPTAIEKAFKILEERSKK